MQEPKVLRARRTGRLALLSCYYHLLTICAGHQFCGCVPKAGGQHLRWVLADNRNTQWSTYVCPHSIYRLAIALHVVYLSERDTRSDQYHANSEERLTFF